MASETSLLPDNEEQRLEAVRRYDVLDTPPDGAFDRVTALAARHFGVPISIVTIVDRDRIWFKSRQGLDVEEIGRDPGLCASAILQDEPWVVENALEDPRTLANPLVAGEFGLRFYAGAPLTTRDGFNLGTLCVIDREPRELSEQEIDTLEDMAAIVMDELELRMSVRTIVEREQALRGFAERTARALQESLLPPALPSIPGVEVAAFYHPADDSVVGGDFYDVFALDGGRWALVVGDVSGKGAEAAAVTALARHTIRTAAMATDDPAVVLEILNQAMFLGREAGDLDHFCTAHLSFLVAEGEGFSVRSASAGHPPGLLLRAGENDAAGVPASGPPVGWHEAPRFETAAWKLAPGDVLLVYTDGLSEARRDRRLVGEDAVRDVMRRSPGLGAQAISAQLHDTLSAPGVEARDDAAAVILRVR